MNFNQQAFECLIASLEEDLKPWKGINALKWASYFISEKELNPKLNKIFNRQDLFRLKDSDFTSEEIVIAILAWGGMNRQHGESLFKFKDHWLPLIDKIRNEEITSRSDAYNSFFELKSNGFLPGMGPAYYTKLICFINPELNAYIMDQWTSKSINLLKNGNLVSLTLKGWGYVNVNNNSNVYESFCKEIEIIAVKINKSPIDTEELLFSYGGFKKGIWRQYVVNSFTKGPQFKNDKSKVSIKRQDFDTFIDLERIEFDQVIELFDDQPVEVITLGKRSSFFVTRKGDTFISRNSKDKQYIIDRELWDKVMNRIDELPVSERLMASRYGDGAHAFNWKNSPNRVSSAHIPAIIKHILTVRL